MPELPEVETTKKGLEKTKGAFFIDVWTDTPKLIKKPSFSEFKKRIKGKKIKEIRRIGKNIILDLSDDYSLLIHLKMTGSLLYGEVKDKYIHLIFFLNNGSQLALSDVRKFAKVELHKTKELKLDIGPDALKEKLNLKGKKGRIKTVLMDQKTIGGIGNIYSDEILFDSKINPFKKTNELNKKELDKLQKSTTKIFKKAVLERGTSVSDYKTTSGKKGGYAQFLKVYQKEKCPICQTKLKRAKIGGRTAHFCSQCQKL